MCHYGTAFAPWATLCSNQVRIVLTHWLTPVRCGCNFIHIFKRMPWLDNWSISNWRVIINSCNIWRTPILVQKDIRCSCKYQAHITGFGVYILQNSMFAFTEHRHSIDMWRLVQLGGGEKQRDNGNLQYGMKVSTNFKLPSACRFPSHHLAAKGRDMTIQWRCSVNASMLFCSVQTPTQNVRLILAWTANIFLYRDRRPPYWMLVIVAVSNCPHSQWSNYLSYIAVFRLHCHGSHCHHPTTMHTTLQHTTELQVCVQLGGMLQGHVLFG